ncbi:MAG: YkgJ family cysteine cluster protein [Candidatus Rokubacteria bacterium]|nr:YkgJ family cysteine cluster protein [Candidatus Rokubacteria bacterium]
MQEHLGKPLSLPAGVVYACQGCGACCRNDWLIGVDARSLARLGDVEGGRVDPALPAGKKFVRLPLPLLTGETHTFARTPGGSCVFLTEERRCAIHLRLGYAEKPQVCREFPYSFVETPDGIAVGLSFACTAVRGHQGQPLGERVAEIREVLAGSYRVQRVQEPILLYSGLDIGWDDYRPIERALLDLLGREDVPLLQALLAGTVLITLAVGLAEIERRAAARGEPARESLRGGLEGLRADGYRGVLEVAARLRYPRRASLAYLAPLYTWVELSRTRRSRFAIVWSLYRNYWRFRRGRGWLADFVTGGAALDLASVSKVRFSTGDAETEQFLRRYWSHVLWRKTLTPVHGVFRGYHTLLALWAFMKWCAKLRAHAAGRAETTLEDVKDAVCLVEQRFVLHAQFARLYTLSPVLTVMADRLYQRPTFARAAVLESA